MNVARIALSVVVVGLVAASGVASCARSAQPKVAALAAPSASVAAASSAAVASALPSFGAPQIDAKIRAEWQRAAITPAPRVDDARFLRRVYLDVVGALPTPDAVVAFERDTAADKRARVVTSLLASPQYAEHWASRWDDVLMGAQVREPTVDRVAFHQWLRERFAENAPWNRIAFDLLSAAGQNSEGGPRRGGYAPPGSASNANEEAPEPDAKINGAVNWTLKFGNTPQDLAGSASRIFLGVQIQCAQCHDHKTEKWKQVDFERFAAAFTRTQLRPLDKGPTMGSVRRVEVRDVDRPVPRFTKNPEAKTITAATPTALDGTDLSAEPNVRKALASWMTSEKNPWFAQAFVNRMWAQLVGRGFVDPVDDMRPSNPAAMPELLAQIADDFTVHGYDVKRLVATLASTEVYQLASAPARAQGGEVDASHAQPKLWSRFRMAPLGPEELLNALMQATSLEQTIRASGKVNLDQVRVQLGRQYAFLFDVDEEFDRDAFEGTMLQALTLLNGSLVGSGARALPGSALADVLAMPGSDVDRIDRLYLRTVSRHPSADESAYWTKALSEPLHAPPPPAPARPATNAKTGAPSAARAPDPLRRLEMRTPSAHDARTEAFEDLLWTLLNSSEFLFNH